MLTLDIKPKIELSENGNGMPTERETVEKAARDTIYELRELASAIEDELESGDEDGLAFALDCVFYDLGFITSALGEAIAPNVGDRRTSSILVVAGTASALMNCDQPISPTGAQNMGRALMDAARALDETANCNSLFV